MTTVKERVARARGEAANASDKVAAISATRLAELRSMPLRAAAQHLDDPRLVQADREALRLMVRKRLPIKFNKPRPSPHPDSDTPSWPRRHWQLIVLTLGALALTGTAFVNTPSKIANGQLVSNQYVHWPDLPSHQTLLAGTSFAVISSTATHWNTRIWRPGKGYALLALPPEVVIVTQ